MVVSQSKSEKTVKKKATHAEKTGVSPYKILLIVGTVFAGVTVTAWAIWRVRTGSISGGYEPVTRHRSCSCFGWH
jgi:hypothetical protein